MQIKRVAQGAELSLINVKNAFLVSRTAVVHRAHLFLRASTPEGNSTARKGGGKVPSFFFSFPPAFAVIVFTATRSQCATNGNRTRRSSFNCLSAGF